MPNFIQQLINKTHIECLLCAVGTMQGAGEV